MTEKSTALFCPCQSSRPYQQCCGVFHQFRDFPPTAEALMRSRYSAYVLKNIDYIVATTVPSQQAQLDQKVLQDWANNTQWLGLKIVHQMSLTSRQSAVEFKAFFGAEDAPQVHHEHSLFVNIDSRWYFIDPTVNLPTNKQPCLCGSGKKFKHCCGAFL